MRLLAHSRPSLDVVSRLKCTLVTLWLVAVRPVRCIRANLQLGAAPLARSTQGHSPLVALTSHAALPLLKLSRKFLRDTLSLIQVVRPSASLDLHVQEATLARLTRCALMGPSWHPLGACAVPLEVSAYRVTSAKHALSWAKLRTRRKHSAKVALLAVLH